MYMTVADLYRKLGNIIHDHQEVGNEALVFDCYVIENGDQDRLPAGSIVFKCVNGLDKSEEYVDLYVCPDPIKTLQ